MTAVEILAGFGLAINTTGLVIVLFKLMWGNAATVGDRMHKLEISSISSATAASDRMHKLELSALEFRAIAAETYMRRDSYHKATDEFKRDVRDAHVDLKKEMHAGFDDLKDQITSVSMSIEANRKASL